MGENIYKILRECGSSALPLVLGEIEHFYNQKTKLKWCTYFGLLDSIAAQEARRR